ncbi:MAG: hypothetical protein IT462_06340 [Planctomycetes bacterium]|nr:hypothetical protein [Planctomycetota bacterium]
MPLIHTLSPRCCTLPASRTTLDAAACFGSAVVILIWLGALGALGAATHPLVPGIVGLVSGIAVLHRAKTPSSRRNVGGLMVALSIVALFCGFCLGAKPLRNGSRAQARPPMYQPPMVRKDPRLDETRKMLDEFQRRAARRVDDARDTAALEKFMKEHKFAVPQPPTEQWLKDYFERFERKAPERELLPLPLPERQTTPRRTDRDDEDEQY